MDLKVILNNVFLDSFFLKSMMIYDFQNSTGTSRLVTDAKEGRHYGNIVIGASFRFITTTVEDLKEIGSGS